MRSSSAIIVLSNISKQDVKERSEWSEENYNLKLDF